MLLEPHLSTPDGMMKNKCRVAVAVHDVDKIINLMVSPKGGWVLGSQDGIRRKIRECGIIFGRIRLM
jgi:hypothetical protein